MKNQIVIVTLMFTAAIAIVCYRYIDRQPDRPTLTKEYIHEQQARKRVAMQEMQSGVRAEPDEEMQRNFDIGRLSDIEEIAYNEKHILPYNPQVDHAYVIEMRRRDTVYPPGTIELANSLQDPAWPLLLPYDMIEVKVGSAVYRDGPHPLAHHDIDTLRVMGEYNAEAAMLMVSKAATHDEQLRYIKIAAKLSGKSADLDEFMERSALYLEWVATKLEQSDET